MNEERPRVTLDQILAGLISQSEDARAERWQQLTGGMFVSVHSQLGTFTLKIWRHNISPSTVEWTTTIRHLPEMYRPIEAVLPCDYQTSRAQGLMASWPIPDRLF